MKLFLDFQLPRELVTSTVTGNTSDGNALRVNYYILIVISLSPYGHINQSQISVLYRTFDIKFLSKLLFTYRLIAHVGSCAPSYTDSMYVSESHTR